VETTSTHLVPTNNSSRSKTMGASSACSGDIWFHADDRLHHMRTRSSGEQRGTTVKAAEDDSAALRPFAQVSGKWTAGARSFPS
jgi:hypothetical protein